jgi:hypothetical protein
MLRTLRRLALLLALSALLLAGVWVLLPPSHDRDWREDYSRLPRVDFASDQRFTVSGIRNWSYAPDGTVAQKEWITATLDRDDVVALHFVLEPFGAYDAIAHTMLAVELTDGSAYVMSIEARREVGEAYEPLRAALWPTYEYMFVWATERDMYGNSEFWAGDQLYWYPLDLSRDQMWRVIRSLAEGTHDLETRPRWYNTLFANCTNVLARTLNRGTERALPFDISWYLPGYSLRYLHGEGLFPPGKDLEALTAAGHLSPRIAEAYAERDAAAFSRRLRALMP